MSEQKKKQKTKNTHTQEKKNEIKKTQKTKNAIIIKRSL